MLRSFLALLVLVAGSGAWAWETPVKTVGARPGQPPSDAIVLFDGTSTEAFVGVDGQPCTWEAKDGALTVGKGFIVSKLHFRDAQVHAEFAVPSEAHGNSGLYFHGHYEMQISDTSGSTTPSKELVGSLYRFELPLVNAGRKAHEWQTYDVVFKAPRYGTDGKIAESGSITALLNGVLVQHNASFTEPRSPYTPYVYKSTPYTARILESIKATDCGPLYLQDHQSPVKFRNVWVRPLDDRAKVFE